MKLSKEVEIAKKAAIEAGKKIMEIYARDFKVEYKADQSPLTEADKAANKIIVRMLKNNFPLYAVLSEEAKDDLSRMENDWCWIVDPLDGTKEFVKRNGEFTVNIALTYQQRPVLGVIYIPVTQELYYATKNNGAKMMDLKSGDVVSLNVTDKLSDLILVASKSHASEQLNALIEDNQNKIDKTVSVGSSIKGCLIAKGEADIYYRFGYTCEWDTAAMQCIAEEAGGIFRQMDGSEMLYNRANNLNEIGFFIVNRKENIFINV